MLTMALCYIDPLSNECSVDLTDKIWLGFFQTCNIKAPFYFVSSKKVLILALDLSGLWCVVLVNDIEYRLRQYTSASRLSVSLRIFLIISVTQ